MKNLFLRAQAVIPGGVNSPVRAFKGVGGEPVFFKKGQGAYLWGTDGKKYLDYVNSWGASVLGHAAPVILDAVQTYAAQGLSFGAPTEVEVLLAEKICQLMPSIEMIRMVNSGTEATMSAIRLARGFTKRDKIVKFIGCYHGHNDGLLVQAGSGGLTFGVPDSAGIPADFAKHTLLAEYNDLETTRALFQKYGDDIAAVIVEPVAANMNCILPETGFLAGLRELCDQYLSLLIFDEVVTGFRVGIGGAQAHYHIKPDLTTLGKIIGGGLPVGAFGGRKDVMECLAPLGPVYQAGTLSGNPVAMAAGLATLQELAKPGFYAELQQTTAKLISGLVSCAQQAGVEFTTNFITGMFGIFFTKENSVHCFQQVKQADLQLFKKFYHAMLDQGIYFGPSMYESGFVTKVHGEKELEITLTAAEKVFTKIK